MANTGFQLEGDAPQVYERNVVPTISKPMVEQMFEHVSLQDGDRALDVACGTGIVTRVAAQRFPNIASIVGVDLNTGMLEVARENTPTTGVPVEWQQGDTRYHREQCARTGELHLDVVMTAIKINELFTTFGGSRKFPRNRQANLATP